jgi:DNA-binding CsgD family transcriptional regulator
MTIKEMREKQMLKALSKYRTIQEAAKVLGISERQLYFFKRKINNENSRIS